MNVSDSSFDSNVYDATTMHNNYIEFDLEEFQVNQVRFNFQLFYLSDHTCFQSLNHLFMKHVIFYPTKLFYQTFLRISIQNILKIRRVLVIYGGFKS